jgi:ABC-2 type transport system permease protein
MANSTKIMTIISHEYLTRVKTKGFLIGTLIGPILMLAVMVIPGLLMVLTSDSSSKKIAVIDKTNSYVSTIVKNNSDLFYASKDNEEALADKVRQEQCDGFLVIQNDFIQTGKAFLYTQGGAGLSFNSKIEDILKDIRKNELLKTAGIDQSKFDDINKKIDINEITVSEKKGEKSKQSSSGFYALFGYGVGFFIYIMMLMYGGAVMRGVIEEKANRIVEVIASSAKPFEIMFGKVIGIGMVGLTQMLFWMVMSGGILAFSAPITSAFGIGNPESVQKMTQASAAHSTMPVDMSQGFSVPPISIWVVVAIIFFFLAGYFMYSTLYAAIGSAVDQEQDAAQLQTPITMIIVIPILCISMVMNDPNGTFAIVMSLIPIFSPILMLTRIVVANGALPFWQVGLSIVLTLCTLVAGIWAASKIYRVGILMYGKKPKLSDLYRWLRSSN